MLRILSADIGATHSRFALFTTLPEKGGASSGHQETPLLSLEREVWLKGADFTSFDDVIASLFRPMPCPATSTGAGFGSNSEGSPEAGAEAEAPPFLDRANLPHAVVIAPAGPIVDGSCTMSNTGWVINAERIRTALGIEAAWLINDFAAQAQACLVPQALDLAPVLPGKATTNPHASFAVVGAGTGFGKAQVIFPNMNAHKGNVEGTQLERCQRALILPSEGGHEEFPFVGEEEFAFAAFAAKRSTRPRLIGDEIVSGIGLAHLFAYITGESLTPPEATARIAEAPKVLEWYARFYGRACRNYVLGTLALGGLFITGGMALRLPVLEHPAFAEEFFMSEAQRALLESVPVWHIRKPQAGLFGAALYGFLQLKHV